jgi:hypothetical protein
MADKGSLEYWSRMLYRKKYEYLSDEQAETVWIAVREFLLTWQEEVGTYLGERIG